MQPELLDPKAITEEDIADIIGLRQELSPNKGPVSPENVLATAETNLMFVIRDAETKRIVAMATLLIQQKLEGRYGYVHDVVVANTHRGRGLSRGIMTDLIVEARSEGLLYLELTSSDERTAAVQLYQSLGFVTQSTNFFRLPL